MQGRVTTTYAEVIDTTGANTSGEIVIRFYDGNRVPVTDRALPLFTERRDIPIIGESVLVYRLPDEYSSSGNQRYRYYYADILNFNNNINNNILPWQTSVVIDETGPRALGNREISPKNIEPVSFESKDIEIPSIFEGDRIYLGRYGQELRFSSTIKPEVGYRSRPEWSGDTNGSPITILQNERDNRLILTSDQRVNTFQFVQSKTGVDAVKPYRKPQAILDSGQIVLSATTDNVLLGAKKDIGLSTSDWAVGVNKMMELLQDTTSLLQKTIQDSLTFYTNLAAATGTPPLTPIAGIAANGIAGFTTAQTQITRLIIEFNLLKQLPGGVGTLLPPGADIPNEFILEPPGEDSTGGITSALLRDGSANPSQDELGGYEQITADETYDGLETVRDYPLVSRGIEYARTEIEIIQRQAIPRQLAPLVKRIIADARAAGVSMIITSGYRPVRTDIITTSGLRFKSQAHFRFRNVKDKSAVYNFEAIATYGKTVEEVFQALVLDPDDTSFTSDGTPPSAFLRYASELTPVIDTLEVSEFRPLTAKLGFSKHNSGIAIDWNTRGSTGSTVADDSPYPWMVNNMHKYGFIRTVRSERWHWEFQGILSEIPSIVDDIYLRSIESTTIPLRFSRVSETHPTWDNLIERI